MTDTSNIPANFPLHTTQLLSTLHAESLAQERGINSDHLKSIKALYPSDHNAGIAQMDELMLDKFIALDQDKCLFVYNTLLAMGAKAVVEAGTSFGVSTIYLALAVAASEKRGLGVCKVIATEKEASKAAKARGIWRECGADVGKVIDLREGDLEETLQGEYGLAEGQAVDGLLLDIWPYVALPALRLVQPRMRPGSVVFVDNTITSREGYKELLSVLRDPQGPWRSITLPYSGGFEMSVYCP